LIGAATFLAAAGNRNIVDELKKGNQIDDRSHKAHLDGYDQMDPIPKRGRRIDTNSGILEKARWAPFTSTTKSIVSSTDLRAGLGEKTKVDVPYLVNLRRTTML
jgi:arylsulfatase